ncbi:uncharacterized protein PAC_04794 [Phialocephala subalpina]|uniref:Uncharacterized protein n=1 Tax=Phialocephala subalpina TaxID=576137 RepID=A0A1L7WQ61_9HELO|nr:uncharacterized protein PAC_04794 [Phialocephala subalpina]
MAPPPKVKGKESNDLEPSNQQHPRQRPWRQFTLQYQPDLPRLRLPPGQNLPTRFEQDLQTAVGLLVPVQLAAFERAAEVPGLVRPVEESSEASAQGTRGRTFGDILQTSTRDLERLVRNILSVQKKMAQPPQQQAMAPQQPESDGQSQPQVQAGPSMSQQQTMAPQPGALEVTTQSPQRPVQYGTGQSPNIVHTTSHPFSTLNSSVFAGSPSQQHHSDFQHEVGQAHQSSDLSEYINWTDMMGEGAGASEDSMFQSFDPSWQAAQPQSANSSRYDGQMDILGAGAEQFPMVQNPGMMHQMAVGQPQQLPNLYGDNVQSHMMDAGAGQNLMQCTSVPMPQMPAPTQRPPPELLPGQVIPIFDNGHAHLHLSGSRALNSRPIPQHITHILNVTQEQLDKRQLKAFKDRYERAPLSEDAPADEDGIFKPVHVDNILTMGRMVLREGGHLLVHDTRAISRAPAAIMIILMEVFGMTLVEADNQVMNRRPGGVKIAPHVWMNVKTRAKMHDKLPRQQVNQSQNFMPPPPPPPAAYQGPIQPQGQQPSAPILVAPWPMLRHPDQHQKHRAFSPLEKPLDLLQFGKTQPLPVQPVDTNLVVYNTRVLQTPNQSYASIYNSQTPASGPAPAQRQRITPPSQPEVPSDGNIDRLLQRCDPDALAKAALEQKAKKLPTPDCVNKAEVSSPRGEGYFGTSGDQSSGQNRWTSPVTFELASDDPREVEQRPPRQFGASPSQSTAQDGQQQNHTSPTEQSATLVFNGKLFSYLVERVSLYVYLGSQVVAPAGNNTYIVDCGEEPSPYAGFPCIFPPAKELDLGRLVNFAKQCLSGGGTLLIRASDDQHSRMRASAVAFFLMCILGRMKAEQAIELLKPICLPQNPNIVNRILADFRRKYPESFAQAHGVEAEGQGSKDRIDASKGANTSKPSETGGPCLPSQSNESVPKTQGYLVASARPQSGFSSTPHSGQKRPSSSLPEGSTLPSAKKQNLGGASQNAPGTSGQEAPARSPPKYGFPESALKTTTTRKGEPQSKKAQASKPETKTERKSNFPSGSDGQERREPRKRGRPKGSTNKPKNGQDATTALAPGQKTKKQKFRQEDTTAPNPGQETNEQEVGQESDATLSPDPGKNEPKFGLKGTAVQQILTDSEHITAFVISHLAPRSQAALDQGIPIEIVQPMEQGSVMTVNNRINPPPPSRAGGSRLFQSVGHQPQINYDTDPIFRNFPTATREAAQMGRDDPHMPLGHATFTMECEHAQRGLIAEHQARGNTEPLIEHPINEYGPRLDAVYERMNALPEPVPAILNPPRQPVRNHTNPFAVAVPGSMAWRVQLAFDGRPLMHPVGDAVTFRNNFSRDEYSMTAYQPPPWEIEGREEYPVTADQSPPLEVEIENQDEDWFTADQTPAWQSDFVDERDEEYWWMNPFE